MSDNARILVVDDVPENVRLLEAVLAGHGYDVSPRTTVSRLSRRSARRGRTWFSST